jgi:hypothetical protein
MGLMGLTWDKPQRKMLTRNGLGNSDWLSTVKEDHDFAEGGGRGGLR